MTKHQSPTRYFTFKDIIGTTPALTKSKKLAQLVVDSDSPICIQGERGVGKDIFAHAIHFESNRSDQPFIAVNCSAIAANRLETVLFGAANNPSDGKFHQAQNGTLFLDEINALPSEIQVALLHTIQQNHAKNSVRIISASDLPLRQAVDSGSFRDDLYYCLNICPIPIAPLRDRRDDIPLLLDHFVTKIALKSNKNVRGIERAVKQDLCNYDWPGNVRQLFNAVQRAIMVSESKWLSWQDFSHVSQALSSWKLEQSDGKRAAPFWSNLPLLNENGDFHPLNALESQIVSQALDFHQWCISTTASALKISRSTLYRKIEIYNLASPKESASP